MNRQNGFTLIELMITLIVLGVLLIGTLNMASSFVANVKLRSVAEDIRVGLLTAKMEAIKRNTVIEFTQFSTGGWKLNIPASQTLDNKDIPLQSRAVSNSVVTVSVVDDKAVTVTKIRFTGAGRVDKGATFRVEPASYSCAVGGDVTCLNVAITKAGNVKLCNPNSKVPGYSCKV